MPISRARCTRFADKVEKGGAFFVANIFAMCNFTVRVRAVVRVL